SYRSRSASLISPSRYRSAACARSGKTWSSVMGYPLWAGPIVALEIPRPEFELCAVDEDAQVVARHAHPLADPVAILLLEKHRREQIAIARLESVDDAPDGELPLLDEKLGLRVCRARIGQLLGLVARLMSREALGSSGFEHHVTAHRVHERAEGA